MEYLTAAHKYCKAVIHTFIYKEVTTEKCKVIKK